MKLNPRAKSIIKYLLCAVIASLVTFVVTLVYFDGSGFMLKFLIKNLYVEEVDTQILNEGANAGMVAALEDEHSVYIDSEYGYDYLENMISGEYAGIGAEITRIEKKAVITKIFSDSPAQKAGLMVGDIIEESGGVPSKGSTLAEVSQRLQGEAGTKVTIKVDRNGQMLEFELTRAPISVDAVTTEVLEDDIGYIRISEFDINTDEELVSALESLKDCKKLIIDLRDNLGGYMDVAMNSIDLFINQGNIVTAKYRNNETVYEATNKNETSLSDEFLLNTPLCILVNQNSASASEIFSASLKDHGRATIVGTQTYGKGSIQTIIGLKNNSGIKLTIGHFYSPKGTKIDKTGVTPDVEVALSEEYNDLLVDEIPRENDAQLKAAVEFFKK